MPFSPLRKVLGRPLDDGAVKAVLRRAGTLFVPQKAQGRLIVAREAGFDLALQPRGGKRGAPLEVWMVCLYGEGVATARCPARSRAQYVHRQFRDVPFGLAFRLRRELLGHLPAPRETWLWGTGAVPVDAPLISYDEWTVDGVQVQAHYTDSVTTPVASADALVRWVDVCAIDG
ncbi:MAG: hypothetical protein JNJ54_16850 [Myxococcaceae bacterium]|nr:hypothetical protein [Myxococcaceae bacterium]